MHITINIYYTGAQAGSAAAFAEEMEQRGIADRIREEKGNLRYEYFISMGDPKTVLLIDSWEDEAALDAHHASPMMVDIAAMREKYDLHMRVERFFHAEDEPDSAFIRK